jgi:hypothetical protein
MKYRILIEQDEDGRICRPMPLFTWLYFAGVESARKLSKTFKML